MAPLEQGRRKRLASALCIAALVAVPFLGKLALWLPFDSEPLDLGGDFVTLMLPWVQSSVDAWREGQLPTWTSLEGIGRPLHVNLQAEAFYPGTILLALVSGDRVGLTLLEIYALLHLAVAGLGAYFLARTLGLGKFPAFLAGAIFPSAGFFLHHITTLSMMTSGAWAPWILGSSFRCFEPGGWRWIAPMALFVALSILGGLPQPAYYAVMIIGLMSIYFAFRTRTVWPVLKLVAVGAISFALAAPTLLPGLRELPELTRGRVWRSAVHNTELLPARLLSIFAPQLDQVMPLAISWVLFFGTPALILAIAGARNKKLAHRGLLIFLAAVFLVVSAAQELGIDGLLAGSVPGYSYFKEHNRAGVIVTLLGALLAAAGLNRLFDKIDRLDRYLIPGAAALVIAAQITVIVWLPQGWEIWRFQMYTLLAIAAAIITGASVFLLRRSPKAAVIIIAVVCIGQLLFITNTNNLRPGIRDRLAAFEAQASVIPREKAPPRVYRRLDPLWPTLDVYNGLNAYRSEDTNQYVVFRRLWDATTSRFELAPMMGVRYFIAVGEPEQTPRSSGDFRLDRFNRVQRFPLAQAESIERLRIKIFARPDEDGSAELSAAIRASDGTVHEAPLESESMQGEQLIRFSGDISFDDAISLEALWIVLETGWNARVVSLSSPQGQIDILPAFRKLGNRVYELTDALPRAYLVPEATPCSERKEMLKRMKKRADLEEQVLLLSTDLDDASYGRPWSAVEAATARADIEHYSRHYVKLEVNAPRRCYLVLSDFYHQAWSATIDCEPTKILPANYCARAIMIPAGEHTIEFRFSDPLANTGIFLSIAALLGCAVVAIWPRTKH